MGRGYVAGLWAVLLLLISPRLAEAGPWPAERFFMPDIQPSLGTCTGHDYRGYNISSVSPDGSKVLLNYTYCISLYPVETRYYVLDIVSGQTEVVGSSNLFDAESMMVRNRSIDSIAIGEVLGVQRATFSPKISSDGTVYTTLNMDTLQGGTISANRVAKALPGQVVFDQIDSRPFQTDLSSGNITNQLCPDNADIGDLNLNDNCYEQRTEIKSISQNGRDLLIENKFRRGLNPQYTPFLTDVTVQHDGIPVWSLRASQAWRNLGFEDPTWQGQLINSVHPEPRAESMSPNSRYVGYWLPDLNWATPCTVGGVYGVCAGTYTGFNGDPVWGIADRVSGQIQRLQNETHLPLNAFYIPSLNVDMSYFYPLPSYNQSEIWFSPSHKTEIIAVSNRGVIAGVYFSRSETSTEFNPGLEHDSKRGFVYHRNFPSSRGVELRPPASDENVNVRCFPMTIKGNYVYGTCRTSTLPIQRAGNYRWRILRTGLAQAENLEDLISAQDLAQMALGPQDIYDLLQVSGTDAAPILFYQGIRPNFTFANFRVFVQ